MADGNTNGEDSALPTSVLAVLCKCLEVERARILEQQWVVFAEWTMVLVALLAV